MLEMKELNPGAEKKEKAVVQGLRNEMYQKVVLSNRVKLELKLPKLSVRNP